MVFQKLHCTIAPLADQHNFHLHMGVRLFLKCNLRIRQIILKLMMGNGVILLLGCSLRVPCTFHCLVWCSQSFRNQRFATLAELVFYYSARNRHIVPVDLASAQEREQQSEPSEELLERGAAIARQFEVGGLPRQVSDASGMEDDDDDVLPPLSSVLSGNRRASGDTNFRQRAMTVPASVAAPEPQATAVPASVVTTEPQASDDGRLQNTITDGHIEYTFAPNTRQERAHTVSEPNNTDMVSTRELPDLFNLGSLHHSAQRSRPIHSISKLPP